MKNFAAAVAVVVSAGFALLAAPPVRAVEGSKIKTAAPFLRYGDAVATGQGVLAVSVKGTATSVTFAVAKLPADVVAPLGVFAEGLALGVFDQVATIDVLQRGAGKVVLASDEGPPAELGVNDLALLVSHRVEIRNGDGTTLLAATFPPLTKFEGTKISSKFGPSDGSPLSSFSAKLTGAPSLKSGSEKFLVKAKGLAPGGAYSLWIEDAQGSENLVLAGDLVDGQFLRDQARGDTLPLGAGSLAELRARAIEVRDESGPVGRGAVPFVAFATVWPQDHLFVIDEPDTTLDRYLEMAGGAIIVYRSQIDLTDVSIRTLEEEGDGNWRMDPLGTVEDGLVCTVRRADNDRYWWIVGNTSHPIDGPQHYLGIYNSSSPPANLDQAKFIFRFDKDAKGRRTARIESFLHPGEYLVNAGHGLAANGIRFDTDLAPVVFGVR